MRSCALITTEANALRAPIRPPTDHQQDEQRLPTTPNWWCGTLGKFPSRLWQIRCLLSADQLHAGTILVLQGRSSFPGNRRKLNVVLIDNGEGRLMHVLALLWVQIAAGGELE